MIYPDDAKRFSIVLDVVFESNRRPKLTKESKKYWFGSLQKHDIVDIENALDEWMKQQDTVPTLKDILNMLAPKQDFYKSLPVPRNEEVQKEGLDKINKLMEKQPTKDYRSWARKIIANPKNYPDISFKFASEALKHG